ncbi:MAG: hypothetical protein EBU96_10140, partial [Actinobacteria bacterium]|nr:hypothetical protein [Actinomycetota bacterium]
GCNGDSVANATVFDASPTTANQFNFTIQAYDQYQNTRQGEANAYIKLVYADGTATNLGRLESTGSVSLNGSNEINANTLTTGGNVTLSNLFHRSGNHTISYQVYSASNPSAAILSPIYHKFNAHGDMVYSYDLSLSPTSPTAGNPVNLTVQARDIAGNAVTGLAPYLNGRTFSWSGASNSPSGASPSGPTTDFGFDNDGRSVSQNYTFTAAQTIATMTLEDQTLPSVSGFGGLGTLGRRIGTVNNVNVINAAASQYELVASTLTPKAGSTFSVDVIVKDAFGNLVKTGWSDTLRYSWTSASPQTNPRTGVQSNPSPQSEATITSAAFNNTTGVYTIGNLRLFRAGQSPTFSVNGSSFSKTLTFGQVPVSDNFDHVKITTSGTYSTAFEVGTAPISANAGTDYTYFAHLFDEFGNLKPQNTNVAWSYTPVQSGTNAILTSPGLSTTFTPNNTGSLTITASCNSIQTGCVSDTSGTITVQPGAITKLEWKVQPVGGVISQTTDACVPLEVEAQDAKGNPVVATAVITFTTTGGDGEFYDTAAACQNGQAGGLDEVADINKFNTPNESGSTRVTGSIGTRYKSLNSGTARTQVWYANRTPGPVTVTAALGTAASLSGTVTAGAARRFTIESTESPIFATGAPSTSDTCAAINYRFQDRWGNNTTSTGSSVIKLSDGVAGGVFHSSPDCSSALSAAANVYTQNV